MKKNMLLEVPTTIVDNSSILIKYLMDLHFIGAEKYSRK